MFCFGFEAALWPCDTRTTGSLTTVLWAFTRRSPAGLWILLHPTNHTHVGIRALSETVVRRCDARYQFNNFAPKLIAIHHRFGRAGNLNWWIKTIPDMKRVNLLICLEHAFNTTGFSSQLATRKSFFSWSDSVSSLEFHMKTFFLLSLGSTNCWQDHQLQSLVIFHL